ncbi:MAG: TetR/AcrR family transcriptional regulator [Lachnospiraceae bacterium]|nr:TetR/AcrR family transcriptional regulator [Lachnospiraceae bacterium]
MNTKNNQRFQHTEEEIVFHGLALIREKGIEGATVSEICRRTGINRKSFYLHFSDMYDLLEKVERKMSGRIEDFFRSGENESIGDSFLQMFRFIERNKEFYKIFLKQSNRTHLVDAIVPRIAEEDRQDIAQRLGYQTDSELDYHEAFFKAGLIALIWEWLKRDCRETPESLAQILGREYHSDHSLFQYRKQRSGMSRREKEDHLPKESG